MFTSLKWPQGVEESQDAGDANWIEGKACGSLLVCCGNFSVLWQFQCKSSSSTMKFKCVAVLSKELTMC
jgi:hypothetical protein